MSPKSLPFAVVHILLTQLVLHGAPAFTLVSSECSAKVQVHMSPAFFLFFTKDRLSVSHLPHRPLGKIPPKA